MCTDDTYPSCESRHYLFLKTLRDILSVQRRVTASFKQKNGSTLHVRKATLPEAELKAIYVGLGIHYQPGGIKKMVV